MAIVNLGDLVPGLEGKTFRLPKGADAAGEPLYEDYHVPGDLDSETVFEFLHLFEEMVRFQQEARRLQAEAGEDEDKQNKALAEVMANLKSLNESIKAKLLTVFQIANPELESLPFGAATTTVVLGEILEMMGLATPPPEFPLPPEGEPPVDPPKPNRAQRRAGQRSRTGKKTTTRSSTRAASRTTPKG